MIGFAVRVLVANAVDRSRSIEAELPVDSGMMFSWIADERINAIGAEKLGSRKFQSAVDIVERDITAVWISINGIWSLTNVVIAKAGANECIGEHTLEGLGLKVDSEQKRLVPIDWVWALNAADFTQSYTEAARRNTEAAS